MTRVEYLDQIAVHPGIDLLEALRTLAKAETASDIVGFVRSGARNLLGADSVALIRMEGDICHYIEEDARTPIWKGRTFDASHCPAGRSISSGRTVVVQDTSVDESASHGVYRDTSIKSALVVPIPDRAGGLAIGAYWSRPRAPTGNLVVAAEAMAEGISTALHRTRSMADMESTVRRLQLERDEIEHRLKNAYASAIGLAGLALPSEFSKQYSGKLRALAAVHGLLDSRNAPGDKTSIGELLAAVLAPYQTAQNHPITLDGPYMMIDPTHATALGLVANELATNAMKHGSLSTAAGRVIVGWSVVDGDLQFLWREVDGPPVNADADANQGSRLLRRLIEGQLRGKLDHHLTSSGVEFSARLPI